MSPKKNQNADALVFDDLPVLIVAETVDRARLHAARLRLARRSYGFLTASPETHHIVRGFAFGKCRVFMADSGGYLPLEVASLVRGLRWEPILALDLGMSCGYAIRGGSGTIVEAGAWDLKQRCSANSAEPYVRLGQNLRDAFARWVVPLVVYERVRAHTGIIAGHVYGALERRVWEECERSHVSHESVEVGIWKKRATGRGDISVGGYHAFARERWPLRDIPTSDEAAARLIAASHPPRPCCR